jgi:predicted acetyltransferase
MADTEVQYEKTESGFKLRIEEDGEPVARLAVGDYQMNAGGAYVRMGGIADVVAHPGYRGKGYGATLLRRVVSQMRQDGYAISILFGIPDFYHRFGYTVVLPSYTVTCTTRDAERLGSGGATVRPATAEDAPALLGLYREANASRAGSLQRFEGHYDLTPRPRGENWWTHPKRVLVADLDGKPAGYAFLAGDPSQFRVRELIVSPASVVTAGVALIHALAEEAASRRLESIALPLPPDEPAVDVLRQVGCKVEQSYPANRGGMGRIVDLPGLATALSPVLAARAESLPAADRPGSLELSYTPSTGSELDDANRAVIQLGKGRSISLTLPQQSLCQLVMGFVSVDAVLRSHTEACPPPDVAALRALFPAGYPHLWPVDHF